MYYIGLTISNWLLWGLDIKYMQLSTSLLHALFSRYVFLQLYTCVDNLVCIGVRLQPTMKKLTSIASLFHIQSYVYTIQL